VAVANNDIGDKTYEIRISMDDGTEDLAYGYISGNDFKNPSGQQQQGFFFQLNEAPKTPLDTIMISSGTKYFIPYRLFGSWREGNPARGKRFISSTVTYAGATHTITIFFDGCISTVEQQQLIGEIGKITTLSNSVIRTLKASAVDATAKYVNNKIGSDTALQKKPEIDAKVLELNGQIATLTSEMTTIETDQPKNLTALQQAEALLQNMVNKDSELTLTYKNKMEAKKAKEDLINTLTNSLNNVSAQKATLETQATQLSSTFSASQNNLRTVAPGDSSSTYINNANQGFVSLSQVTVDTNLNRIIS